jgi:hypothetical protein
MQVETRRRVANLTSNILNPFLVSLVIIFLLSFESASGVADALKWSLISIGVSILPVFCVMVYLARKGRLDGIFTNVRKQRTEVYLLAIVCAVAGGVIITCLGAPLVLRATFVAALSAVVVFMCVNLWWKISLHIAFVAASVTALIILYGPIGAISVVFLPLIAWARIEAGHHSVAQVATGAILAAGIEVVVFYLFGLV